MLTIGNVYGHGLTPSSAAAIEAAGFAFRPGVTRFDGSQVCRFLDFAEGSSLEFIEVESDKAYLDFVPLGMKPYAPGISLVVPDRAERDFPYFEKRFPHLRPYRLHANYDGTRAPGRPGWDYLNFAVPVVRDTFVWLTHPGDPRPRKAQAPSHPNGARGVRGLVFTVHAEDLERLAQLAEREVVDGVVNLDGVLVWGREALAEPLPLKPKVFPLAAVVVETANLEALPAPLRAGHEVTFCDRPAVHLETNDLSWDLLITGPGPPDPHRGA